ncbi:MAG: tol-pal system protein YbgF [Maritimibacter sp.]
MRIVKTLGAAALVLGLAGTPVAAQDNSQTLADIRQELTVLYVSIQKLKVELNTTGGAVAPSGSGSTLDRVIALESELTRLTSKIEQLEHRVDTVVRDGTNTVGDLEFRLCELEPDCNIADLGDTPTLGGGELPMAATPSLPAAGGDQGGTELAVAEQEDFDMAKAAFDAGDYNAAADQFARYTQTYPGGPLVGQANYLRGEALAQMGQVAEAARAYLASYSGEPNGANSANALLKLGAALGELGQVNEACVTLAEVGNRFPGSPAVAEAAQAREAPACP